MTQQCNICGEVCSMDISDIGKCKLCERLSHRRCSGTTDEICSLCNRIFWNQLLTASQFQNVSPRTDEH